MGIREGHEWDRFEGLSLPEDELARFLDKVPFNREGARRLTAATVPVPERLAAERRPVDVDAVRASARSSTRSPAPADRSPTRIVTTSPDVTVSTNLGAWVNRRGLFARDSMADTFREERIASTQNWEFGPKGQHIELGIAEMNLFILLSALGLSHSLFGERLLPVGTLYDPFIQRGLDALNYACYQDARFLLVATPSGVTLAPEGGAHQSIATPLIGMAQDGLAAFEPAFVDELAVIMRFAFDYMQRDGEGEPSTSGPGCATRPAARSISASRPGRSSSRKREMTPTSSATSSTAPTGCGEPGPNAEVVVAYTGAVAPEAIEAVGLMAEDRRDVGLLAVTSADRLNAGWTAAARARERGLPHARSHIERLLAGLPRALRPRHRARRPPGDARLARRGRWATARARSASSISARPGRSPTSTATTASTPRRSSPRPRRSPRRGRSGTCGRWGSIDAYLKA